jgi:hypothetical protein
MKVVDVLIVILLFFLVIMAGVVGYLRGKEDALWAVILLEDNPLIQTGKLVEGTVRQGNRVLLYGKIVRINKNSVVVGSNNEVYTVRFAKNSKVDEVDFPYIFKVGGSGDVVIVEMDDYEPYVVVNLYFEKTGVIEKKRLNINK